MTATSSEFSVNGRKIGVGHPAYVIAEIGFNHEGDIELAKDMISAAHEAGADSAKLQTYKADELTLKNHPHFELILHGELDLDAHVILADHARKVGIEFLSTPFSLNAVKLLEEVGVSAYKVASMDVTYHPMLEAIADTGKPVFFSTGMAIIEEISAGIEVLQSGATKDIALMHCVSHYPPKLEDANIASMDAIANSFGFPTGYSDHVLGPVATLTAVARGACVIEKHFTTDKNLPGPDHKISADTAELKSLIKTIREVETAIGRICVDETRPDRIQAQAARRGIYANGAIQEGAVFNENNLKVVRPENNLAPGEIGKLIGSEATSAFADEASIS